MTHRHVRLSTRARALAQLTAGQYLPFATGERTGMTQNVHHQGRLVDAQQRQRRLAPPIGQSVQPMPIVLDTVTARCRPPVPSTAGFQALN